MKNHYFPYLFPGRELWHWRRGWGWWWVGGVGGVGGGGGPFRTPTILKLSPKIFRTKIVHTSGTFFPQNEKHIFKLSSYIQKKTPNTINAFKITIIQNTPTIQTYILQKSNFFKHIRKNSNTSHFYFLYISNAHNLYFVSFVYFIYFHFCIICIFIYIYTYFMNSMSVFINSII